MCGMAWVPWIAMPSPPILYGNTISNKQSCRASLLWYNSTRDNSFYIDNMHKITKHFCTFFDQLNAFLYQSINQPHVKASPIGRKLDVGAWKAPGLLVSTTRSVWLLWLNFHIIFIPMVFYICNSGGVIAYWMVGQDFMSCKHLAQLYRKGLFEWTNRNKPKEVIPFYHWFNFIILETGWCIQR